MGVRKLLLSHVALNLKKDSGADSAEPPPLPKGFMRLYSFYRPNLRAGDYEIEVEQQITAPNTQTLKILNVRGEKPETSTPSPQRFSVVWPHFTIDRSIINSYYPPDGHQDEGRILPHIVFNDPHYPWEIPAGAASPMDKEIDEGRNMVPWVALLVFDVEELQFASTELEAMKGFKLEGFTQQADLKKQNANGTFSMTVDNFARNVISGSKRKEKFGNVQGVKLMGNTDMVNVIFPQKQLARKVIGQYLEGTTGGDIQAYKYLAHVRHINTEDCPDAIVQQEGIFSVVISPRTGPIFDNVSPKILTKQPKTQVCHLVSIEHLDADIATWSSGSSGRVGLVSLFSWIYTALPPNPVNFVTTMRNLTEKQQMLRIEDEKLAILDKATKTGDSPEAQVGRIIAARLRAGYTVSRWRTQTGEETAAFTRGPLVPLVQANNGPPAADMLDCSNTSQSYQILDPQSGMMDLTYSSAWQIGKMLAISDTNFSAALMRLRSKVYDVIASKVKMKANEMRNRKRIVTSLPDAIKALSSATINANIQPFRFRPTDTSRFVHLLKDADAEELLQTNTASVVGYNTKAGDQVFTEFNKDGPNNSDWAIIHCWLADKLLLGGIPSQYLLPESSYLQRESLRFFYIDDFWLDCLIDGALSIANHLDGDDDKVRRELKKDFNLYLQTPVSGIKPQIPCYGFIIRSQLIKVMPDMKIEVTWQLKPGTTKDKRLDVCRWSKWDEQTLLALLDRPPEELESIVLKQPQHQQRFSLGSGVDVEDPSNIKLDFELRKLFTGGFIPKEWKGLGRADVTNWYDIQSRTLKLGDMAKDLNRLLQRPEKPAPPTIPTDPEPPPPEGPYVDTIPNSVEFGLELNDPCYYFEIHPPTNKQPTWEPRNRQLWVAKPPPARPRPKDEPYGRPPRPSGPPKPPATGTSTPTPPAGTIPIPTAPDRQARIQPLPRAIADRNARPTTTTIQSRFDLRVFPDYRGPPKRYPQDKYDPQDFIPTQNIYFFDLIFSIRKKPNVQQSLYDLLKIVIDLPVTSDSNAQTEALLTPNYDGPGLRMLSNQRFIPFLYHDVPSAPMHIELIPRSADDDYALKINDRKTKELGFRLAEANVSEVKVSSDVEIVGERFRQPRGKVVVTMTEYYKSNTPDGVDAVTTRYRLIKWDTQDDVELGT